MVKYNERRGKEFKNKEIRNDRDNFERRIGRKKNWKEQKFQAKKNRSWIEPKKDTLIIGMAFSWMPFLNRKTWELSKNHKWRKNDPFEKKIRDGCMRQ